MLKTNKNLIAGLMVIVLCMSLFSVTVFAEDEIAEATFVYVGGVELSDGDYLDNKGTVTDTKPEGGYAYFENGVLTLNEYSYEGTGYQHQGTYNSEEGGEYIESRVIYSKEFITIQLEGKSILKNTLVAAEDVYSCGIVFGNGGKITGTDDSLLEIHSGSEGIFNPSGKVNLEKCTIVVDSGAAGIDSEDGIEIVDSEVRIISKGEGIYSYAGDVNIVDSIVHIESAVAGIYAYDGGITIDCTKVESATPGSYDFIATNVYVKAGNEYALYAYNNPIVIAGALGIYTPEAGSVLKNEEESFIVDLDGNIAKEVSIELVTYKVALKNPDMNFDMAIPVPRGCSVVSIYDSDTVEFFAKPTRENYVFDGWYVSEDEGKTLLYEFSFDAPVESDLTIYAKWLTANPSLGDVDRDNDVDANDALLVLKHAARLETLTEDVLEVADVKHDELINAEDALEILKIAAKITESN